MTTDSTPQQQELRRGSLVLACLQVLRSPDYGYGILKRLHEVGITVDGNTLYPLLRRLEAQGLLESDWKTDQARPRKFYRLTRGGASLSEALWADFVDLSRSLTSLRGEDPA